MMSAEGKTMRRWQSQSNLGVDQSPTQLINGKRASPPNGGGDEYSDNLIEFLSDLGTNLSKQIPALDEKGQDALPFKSPRRRVQVHAGGLYDKSKLQVKYYSPSASPMRKSHSETSLKMRTGAALHPHHSPYMPPASPQRAHAHGAKYGGSPYNTPLAYRHNSASTQYRSPVVPLTTCVTIEDDTIAASQTIRQIRDFLSNQGLLQRCARASAAPHPDYNDMPQRMGAAIASVSDAIASVARGEYRNQLVVVRATVESGPLPSYMELAVHDARRTSPANQIAIVDLDVGFDAALQNAFLEDPSTLHISLHHGRRAAAKGASLGTSVDIGFGPGQGRTINVNWAEKLSTGDAEYVAAMRSVVSPVLKSFRPDCIVLRTNFGSHNLTPAGYAYIVHLLYRAAHGRIVVVAEQNDHREPRMQGERAAQCLRTLLGQALPALSHESLVIPPRPPAVEAIQTAVTIQSRFWPQLAETGRLASMSIKEQEATEKVDASVAETAETLAALSMIQLGQGGAGFEFDSPAHSGSSYPYNYSDTEGSYAGGDADPGDVESAAVLLSLGR